MAKEAERLLADTGWLREPLRLADLDRPPAAAVPVDPDDSALPPFLDEDGSDQMDDQSANETTLTEAAEQTSSRN